MATETEAKYSLMSEHVPSEAELAAALAEVGLETGPARHVVNKDRYYDDARLSLARSGFALRRRMADGRLLATLKTLGTVDGAVHRRDEIELPIPDDADPWEPWPTPIADRVRTVADPRSLRGTFELVVERVSIELIERGRTVAVASFDDVAARRPSAERSVHWNELEIESVAGSAASGDAASGDAGAGDAASADAASGRATPLTHEAVADVLERAATAIDRVVTLVPSSQTKLERAQALLMLGVALDGDRDAAGSAEGNAEGNAET